MFNNQDQKETGIYPHLTATIDGLQHSYYGIDEKESLKAVELIRNHKRVVICSMGKPAFACAKAVYTAHSFGLDWIELDATHAFHGDIGVVRKGDLIIMVSKSGNTDETNDVAGHLKLNEGHTCLAITSNEKSQLGRICDYQLIIPIQSECSPFGHAPMVSTTIYMMVLHALLCEAIEANDVTIEQYARNHPSGQIGKDIRNGD